MALKSEEIAPNLVVPSMLKTIQTENVVEGSSFTMVTNFH